MTITTLCNSNLNVSLYGNRGTVAFFIFFCTVFVVYSFVICLLGQLLVHFVPFCPAHLLTYWHIVRYLWANKWWWWCWQTAGLVIQPFHAVAEDIFILSAGPKRNVNPSLTAIWKSSYLLISRAARTVSRRRASCSVEKNKERLRSLLWCLSNASPKWTSYNDRDFSRDHLKLPLCWLLKSLPVNYAAETNQHERCLINRATAMIASKYLLKVTIYKRMFAVH